MSSNYTVEGKGANSSPQDFLWLAEYPDGTNLAEYDVRKESYNSFYSIDKSKLFRFGLVGHGSHLYFERDGVFNIAGRRIHFIYEVDGKEIPLNGDYKQNVVDIITFKEAEATSNMIPMRSEGTFFNQIVSYNFGYKTKKVFAGYDIHFKAIVQIKRDMPVSILIKMTSDKELKGKFNIKVNGSNSFSCQAPIASNLGGELTWVVS